MAGVRRYKDLFAWQLADKFKREIYRLVLGNYEALRAWKYRDQILESVSAPPKDVLEGFVRFSPAQFSYFLSCALASLAEAEEWLKDGVLRGYFKPDDAAPALLLAKRAWMATLGLKRSQDREAERRRNHRRQTRRPPRASKPSKPPRES